jgi:prepilin-type N-terminal cleavage/methylation domain-containing protein/prepilin-type processing-associated H-X9-DG protein
MILPPTAARDMMTAQPFCLASGPFHRFKSSEASTMHTNESAHRGFTLVELLVVVAIIALLLAILIPSLQRARQVTEAVVCKSNLRQVMTTVIIYCDDNRSVFPVNRRRRIGLQSGSLPRSLVDAEYLTYSTPTVPQTEWPSAERGATKLPKILQCPSYTRGWDPDGNQTHFMSNTRLSPVHSSVESFDGLPEPRRSRLTEVDRSAEVTYLNDWWWTTGFGPSHMNRTQANHLFLDGHVDDYQWPDVWAEVLSGELEMGYF